MKKRFHLLPVLLLSAAVPALAQHPNEGPHGQPQHGGESHQGNYPRANQGRVPPPPVQRNTHAKVEMQRHDNGKVNGWQHVDHDHWYGHDKPNDRRFHLDHPFEHGHFVHFGPSYRYNIVRFDRDRHRFWLPGGFFFEVAAWDWPVCADWCWDCGDDFAVYEDPDHIGWYMLYNVHTGVYVHVTYLGT